VRAMRALRGLLCSHRGRDQLLRALLFWKAFRARRLLRTLRALALRSHPRTFLLRAPQPEKKGLDRTPCALNKERGCGVLGPRAVPAPLLLPARMLDLTPEPRAYLPPRLGLPPAPKPHSSELLPPALLPPPRQFLPPAPKSLSRKLHPPALQPQSSQEPSSSPRILLARDILLFARQQMGPKIGTTRLG
jgi:hypothetical protein